MRGPMKSFLFDTNALIYWVNEGAGPHGEVSALVRRAVSENMPVFALASSLNDVYYAMRRHYSSEAYAREAVRDIAELFDLVDLAGPFVFDALDSDELDYEDGLIRAAAEALQVSAIVSYDKKAFQRSVVPRMTAAEVLAKAGA